MMKASRLADKAARTMGTADIEFAANIANEQLFDAIDAAQVMLEITKYDRLQVALELIAYELPMLQSALADIEEGETE